MADDPLVSVGAGAEDQVAGERDALVPDWVHDLPARTDEEMARWEAQDAAFWMAWDEQEARALAGLPWGNVHKRRDGSVCVEYPSPAAPLEGAR